MTKGLCVLCTFHFKFFYQKGLIVFLMAVIFFRPACLAAASELNALGTVTSSRNCIQRNIKGKFTQAHLMYRFELGLPLNGGGGNCNFKLPDVRHLLITLFTSKASIWPPLILVGM